MTALENAQSKERPAKGKGASVSLNNPHSGFEFTFHPRWVEVRYRYIRKIPVQARELTGYSQVAAYIQQGPTAFHPHKSQKQLCFGASEGYMDRSHGPVHKGFKFHVSIST
jgi:hypothetical protein